MSGETPCVYCRRHPVESSWRPFCSERCKLLDLRDWVDGRYSVPGETTSSRADGEPPDGHNGTDN